MHQSWFEAIGRWQPSEHAPPRLYFEMSDLSALQMRRQAFPLLWGRIREAAVDALEQDPEPQDNQVYTLRHWLGVASAQALVGLLEERADLQARAWELAQSAFAQEDWVIEPHKPLRVDLFYAAICAELGQIYDWLTPVLSTEQREMLAGELKRRVAPFAAITARRAEDWQTHHWVVRNMNWKSVVHSEMGIAALAIQDQVDLICDVVRSCLQGVLDVLDDPAMAGQDGAYAEGLGYWGYAMSRAVWFGRLLKRVTDGEVDLFEHPYLRETGDYALHMWTPGGGSFGYEDCSREQMPHPLVMSVLADAYRREDYQWMAKLGLESTSVFSNELLVQFLFADPKLPARRPELPTARYFPSIETAAMRSGWDDGATFFGLHAGATAVPHSHLDIGTFTLIGRGERLVDDAGKWPYDHAAGFFNSTGPRWDYESNATIGHNTVLVDGQGQIFGKGCEGRIIAKGFGASIDTLICDVTDAYDGRLARFVRYVAFLKPEVLVIIDDLAADEPRRFSWLLHTDGTVALEGTRWTIDLRNAGLDVRILGFDQLGDRGGFVVGLADRYAHYEDYNHMYATPVNRYAVFETLHPVQTWLVPAVLHVRGPEDETPLRASLAREDGQLSIEVSHDGDAAWHVAVDMNQREMSVTST